MIFQEKRYFCIKKTQNYICSCVINLIILNHELISEAEFRDIHVRFVKEIKKLDKDDKKNVILYTQLHLIISCLEEVELEKSLLFGYMNT